MTRWFRCTLALLAALAAVTTQAATELTVAVYSNLDEAVKAAIPAWEKAHPDVTIRVVSLPFGEHNRKIKELLQSGAETPDVVAGQLWFMREFGATTGLEDLAKAPYQARPLLSQMLPFSLTHALSGEKVEAIPFNVGPGTLYYRKDVLDRAGVTEEELTRSWDSFLEAGKKLKAATGASLMANASEVVDILIRNGLKDGEGIFYDAKGAPAVDSPRFQQAFALARKLRDAGVDGRIGTWTEQWARGLEDGTIATQPIGSWFEWHLRKWLAPKTKGKWRVAQLPGGALGYWGGDYLAVPRSASHKPEAWEFVKFLCLDREQQLQAFKKTGNWPALIAAQEDPYMDEPVAFFGDQKARQVWKASAAKIPPIPIGDKDASANGAVYKALQRVLDHELDVAQALAELKTELQE